MKKTILLSIKPKYVEQILAGEKQYEFRTILPKQPVGKILIYEMAPVKKVVGEATVINVLVDEPNVLWTRLTLNTGLTKDRFDAYFKNKRIAYAYELGKVIKYEEAKDLSYYGVKRPTQSFIYID